jgi:NAD(P)-dependent dehydrogenase (short-subunit alcohol dehydrogenase family)
MSPSKPSTRLAPSTKTVLITGCSKNSIGSSLALSFCRRPGFHIFSTARSLTNLGHLSSVPNITCIELDVTCPPSVASAVSFIKEKTGGRLDYLVNNAGLAYRSPALEADEKEARRLMEVNFWGVVRMCEAFGAMVVEAKGAVVNVGSASGRVGGAWMGESSPLSPFSHLVSSDLAVLPRKEDKEIDQC